MAIGIGIGLTFGRRKGIDAQAQAAFNSLQSAGFTTPQGIVGINAAFKTIKTIYGTSDITTAISFFGDPSLAYQIGAGSGTTLGQAIRTLPNLIDPTRATDAVQTTAASQPLLLVHSGANYYWNGGVSGNFCSTPNNTNNNLIDNFSFEFRVSNLSGVVSGICGKASSATANYNFRLQLSAFNLIQIAFSTNGTSNTNYNSTVIATQEYIRVSRNSTTGEIKFFQSNDGITFTQLGATVSGITGALFSSTADLLIGSSFTTSGALSGVLNYVKIFKDDTFTTPTQIFNPNQYNPSTSQTQWTSSTGEVWTLNVGTATTGYKGRVVTNTIMQSDGVDDNLRVTSLPALGAQTVTLYAANRALSNTVGILAELSNNGTDPNIFILQQSNGTTRETLFGTRGTASNVYSAPANTALKLTTVRANNALTPAAAEIDMYYNNTLQSKSSIVTTDQTFTFNTAYPLNIFSRNGGAAERTNSELSTFMVCKTYDSVAIQTGIYNYIRSVNANSF